MFTQLSAILAQFTFYFIIAASVTSIFWMFWNFKPYDFKSHWILVAWILALALMVLIPNGWNYALSDEVADFDAVLRGERPATYAQLFKSALSGVLLGAGAVAALFAYANREEVFNRIFDSRL